MAFITLLVVELSVDGADFGWSRIAFCLAQLVVWFLRLRVMGRSVQRLSRLEALNGLPDGSKGVGCEDAV